MAHGRARALALSAGVVSGSLFWGWCGAAAGEGGGRPVPIVDGLAGGAQAAPARTGRGAPGADAPGGFAHIYLRGAAMHLTNPKAVFVWLSVVSLALPADARLPDTLAFVGSCVLISASVFCCYALAFSTAAARRGYQAAERWVNLGLAGVFAYAGVRMLLSSQAR
jgi:threonine/homoserine/homoserine lactone efflux protein